MFYVINIKITDCHVARMTLEIENCRNSIPWKRFFTHTHQTHFMLGATLKWHRAAASTNPGAARGLPIGNPSVNHTKVQFEQQAGAECGDTRSNPGISRRLWRRAWNFLSSLESSFDRKMVTRPVLRAVRTGLSFSMCFNSYHGIWWHV